MSFTPVATTDTLETFRTRYNATNITIVDDSSTSVDITLATDSLKLSGGTGIASAISGDTVTFNLSNSGVSAATYGSSTAIPVIAVNAQGQITSASTASISTDLTLVDDASSSATISLATDTLKISGGTGTTSAVSGDTLTINLDNTAVSAASYGSASAIPVITVDAQGRITAASTASVSSDLTIADTSSTTEVITLGSETLKFDGGTGISASISSGTVTYNFDGTSFTTFVYTATSGQTSFSGADDNGVTLAYSAGKRNVFLNGVLLDESDITASNGTSVVLASGAAASDILTVIAFAVNNIAVLDANGSEFVLDADGDTSITADTDDQIDFKIAGADDFRMTANTFTALAGSDIVTDRGSVRNRPNPLPLIINGDMRVAQRVFDASFSKASVSSHSGGAVVAIDRMYTGISDNGTFTISRDTDVPSGYGFVNSMKLDCTTADTSVAAGSFHTLEYRFEGQDTQLFKKGTSNAYAMTVAFWIKSSVTGTAVVELADDDNSRHICKTFTVDSADTWEKKVLAFAGDTSGALTNDTGRSFRINIFLGAGSNLTSGTLATSWASRTTANIAAGQTINAASSTDNNIFITGLQMELGEYTSTTIPEFQFEERGASLRRCYRYYQHHVGSDGNCAGTAAGGYRTSGTAQLTFHFPVEMRADPTVAQVATDNMFCHDLADGNNNSVDSVESTIHSSTGGITVQFNTDGTGVAGDSCHLIPNGSTPGMTFDAEVG